MGGSSLFFDKTEVKSKRYGDFFWVRNPNIGITEIKI